jgi:hypothetical protein
MLDLSKTFLKFEDEYGQFGRIKDKLHPSPDVCAFLLLYKLAPWEGDMVTSAEHDETWLAASPEELAENASEDDILTLVRCGIRFDEDLDSLAMFV